MAATFLATGVNARFEFPANNFVSHSECILAMTAELIELVAKFNLVRDIISLPLAIKRSKENVRNVE